MAKQTFTTGQTLLASQMTSLQQTAMGGGAATAKTASYVLVAADAGTTIIMNSGSATTITINDLLFAAGDTVNIQNIGSGITTITNGSATVNTAGSLALNQYEGGVLYFRSASTATFFDYVQTGSVSPLTTKGDLYGFSTLDARIPIGTNNQVLTADSTQALGLKWATASSGGMTLLSTTTPSGSSTSINVTPTGYNYLYINIYGISSSSASEINMTLNNYATGNNYFVAWYGRSAGSFVSSTNANTFASLTATVTCQASNTDNATQIMIFDPNNTTSFPKNFQAYHSSFNASGARQIYSTFGSVQTGVGALTSIQFNTGTGSWNNGTIQVYGVK